MTVKELLLKYDGQYFEVLDKEGTTVGKEFDDLNWFMYNAEVVNFNISASFDILKNIYIQKIVINTNFLESEEDL